MVRQSDASLSDLDAALEGSACLGAWSFDTWSGTFSCATGLSRMLEIDPETTLGTSLRCLLSRIHVEDRARVESHFHAADESAGPFEIEFRTSADGQTPSWLRLMGGIGAYRASSAARLRGLAFDLTERRLTRGLPDQQVQHRINQLADHVIAMKFLLAGLDNSPLSKMVDKVAIEIGFELARRLSQSDPANRN